MQGELYRRLQKTATKVFLRRGCAMELCKIKTNILNLITNEAFLSINNDLLCVLVGKLLPFLVSNKDKIEKKFRSKDFLSRQIVKLIKSAQRVDF